MNRKSIKTRLFLLLALMGAIPFIASIIFIGWRNVLHLGQHARVDAWTRNININEHLTQMGEKNIFVLRTLAGAPIIRRYLENPQPEDEAIVMQLLRNTNSIFQDDNTTAMTNAQGMQILRTDTLPKVNIAQRKHFQEAMEGRDYISDVMTSLANGELVLVAVSPVFDEQHRAIGMVQRNFYLNQVQKFIQTQSNDNVSVIITDRANTVIAQTEKNEKYTKGMDMSKEIHDISEALDWGDGVTRMEMDGQDSLVTLSRDKLTGWSIITITPYGNIWYTVHDAVIRGAILGFVIMLFVNLAAHLLATRIIRPLEEINEVISNMTSGKGDIDQLHTYKDSELGDISTALNEMRHIHEGLIKETQVDKLTGLYNQYSVEEFCRHKLREYEDAPSPGLIAIMLVDLDHFKKANREEGRLYGDRVLKEFADKLKNLFPGDTCIGRLEADEFVVVLDKQKDKETIRAKAQLINETARNITVGEDKVGLTVSIGVAIAPYNGKTYNHLFHAADLALYEVKEQGRDNYKLADDLDA